MIGETDYYWNGTPQAIHKINTEGTLLASFFTKDEVVGREDARPRDIVVGQNGDIYVSENFSNQVRRYDSGGVYIGSIDLVNGSGELIITNDNHLYAAGNGSISQYDLLGNLTLSIPSYSYPSYMTADEDSNIYVSKNSTHELIKYSPTGIELGSLDPGYNADEIFDPGKIVIHGEYMYVASDYGKAIKIFNKDTLSYINKIDGKKTTIPTRHK